MAYGSGFAILVEASVCISSVETEGQGTKANKLTSWQLLLWNKRLRCLIGESPFLGAKHLQHEHKDLSSITSTHTEAGCGTMHACNFSPWKVGTGSLKLDGHST